MWPPRVLARGLGLLILTTTAVAQEDRLDFDIPAQALATALEQYGKVSGLNGLYDSNLLIDRRSVAVRGRMSSNVAIATLLQGTGLVAVRATPTSFTLSRVSAEAIAQEGQQEQLAYYGRIQASLQAALCNAGDAQPGSYRIGMRLWIDSTGQVTHHERVTSSGSTKTDASIDAAVERMHIEMSPPPGAAQPVAIVVRPQAAGVTMTCADFMLQAAGKKR